MARGSHERTSPTTDDKPAVASCTPTPSPPPVPPSERATTPLSCSATSMALLDIRDDDATEGVVELVFAVE
jgi:hypothetical protein